MDVRQLLLLAGGNSALAKKKVDRLTAQENDDDSRISGDAVAAYLAKQKAFKEKIKAEEAEAKKRRVQARLDAALGKPTRKEKKMVEKEKAINGHFLPGDKRSMDAEKDKMKERDKERLKASKKQHQSVNGEKAKSSKSKEHRKRSQTPETSIPKKKVKSDKDRDKSESSKSKEKEKNGESGEKRYRRRIPDTFETSIHEERLKEKERLALLSKEKAKKKAASANPNAGLSFTDLLKLAKTNASSARLADDGSLIKKKEKVKTYDEENTKKKVKGEYEAIRDMQKKMKKEDALKKPKQRDTYDESPPSRSKHEYHKSKSKNHEYGNDDDYKRKEKKKMNNSDSHKLDKASSKERLKSNDRNQSSSSSSSKHKQDLSHSKHKSNKDTSRGKYVEDSPSPKRGLIAQTISTKKNGALSKPHRPTGIEAQFRGIKPSGIEAQFMKRGLQQKAKMKKRPMSRNNDYEDDFEKEARELARKRKLFEMQRITGNSNLVEEDVMSDYDDYDLSEDEDEDDADFIDDSEPVENVSKYIRKITGYDRRLYDDSDEDDRRMESSYSQIEKEEARSSRIAREEDRIAALEEAAELAREKAMEEARMKKKGKR